MMSECYICKYNNQLLRFNSTSGGFFFCLAKYMIEKYDAHIYGAVFDDNYNVIHKCVTTIEQLKEVQGSKYPQSNLSNVFKKVKKDIDDNRYVLFSGTPCQIAAIKKYVGDTTKLVAVDLICYGVAAPRVWKEYLNCFCGKGVKKIVFKYKKDGWKNWKTLIHYAFYSIYLNGETNTFMHNYMNGTFVRPSCARCAFKADNRFSDYTIGDAWGEAEKDEMNDDKGLSIVVANTETGKRLFREISDLEYKRVELSKYMKGNPYYYSIPRFDLQKQELFINDLQKNGFYKAYKKNCIPRGLRRARYLVKLIMGVKLNVK